MLKDVFTQARDRATFLLRRRSFYRATFENRNGTAVLADLKQFCRHGESPIVVSPESKIVDAIATGVRIGRQEVFERIRTHINIDDKDLLNLKEDHE